MRKFIPLWVLLLTGSLLLQAAPAAAQTTAYHIELTAPSESLRHSKYPFYVQQVVDARPNRSGLGTIRRGLGNTPIPADFQKGLEVAVTDFLNYWVPPQPTLKPLLLRITTLRVGEYQDGNGEHGTAEVAAEWYYPGADGQFNLVRYTNRYIEESTVLGDVTPTHGRRIADLLLEMAAEVAATPETQPTPAAQAPGFTLAQLQLPQAPRPLPILATKTLQAGIYHSFSEWQQNRPQEPGRPVVDARPYHTGEWAGYLQVTPYRPTPEGRRVPVNNAWGFCDGERVYVRFAGSYYLLEKRGPNYLFFAPAPPSYSQAGSMVGGVLGGAMGGAILGRSTDGHKFPFGLDVQTGQIAPYGSLSHTADGLARPTTLLLLYSPDEKKTGPQVQVTAPAPAVSQTLAPRNYASFSWPSVPSQPLCLAVPGLPAACQTLELAAGVANYYQVIASTSPGSTPTLRRLDAQTGAALLRRLMR